MITYSKKICLLGDFAVGKTSLVRRFVYNHFDEQYISTIGVRVSRKTVAVPLRQDVAELTMMVWDLAGSEEFTDVSLSYLRGAAGAVLVYDLTRPTTLEPLYTNVMNLHRINPQARFVVAGNKADLIELPQLDRLRAEKFAAEIKAPLYFTSAKQGNEVDELFRHLGRLIVA